MFGSTLLGLAAAVAATGSTGPVCDLGSGNCYETIQLALDAGEDDLELQPGIHAGFLHHANLPQAYQVTVTGLPGAVVNWSGLTFAVIDHYSGELTLRDLEISGEDLVIGIETGLGLLELQGVTVRDGRSGWYGGGIGAIGTDVTVSDSVFTNNRGWWGGAIGIANGTLELSGQTTLFDNSAVHDGGAVHVAAGDLVITGEVVFRDNRVEQGDGGHVRQQGAQSYDLDITCDPVSLGCPWFETGDAVDQGGAIALSDIQRAVIEGATFQRNAAEFGGAVSSVAGGDLQFIDTLFLGDSAKEAGGAFHLDAAGDVALTRVTVGPADPGTVYEALAAAATGGAGYLQGPGPVSIDGSVFDRSQADAVGDNVGGGALHIDDPQGDIDITTTRFDGTSTAGAGGGLFVKGGGPHHLHLSEVEFHLSDAQRGGGLAAIDVAHVTVENTWFCGTAATNGGGAYVESGCLQPQCVVRNSVFVDTVATNGGGAVAVKGEPSDTRLERLTALGVEAGDGAFVDASVAVRVEDSVADTPGDTSVLRVGAGTTASNLNLTNGGVQAPIDGIAAPTTLTEDLPDWFPGAGSAAPSTDRGPCDVEVRLHPLGNLGGRDVGAFEGGAIADWIDDDDDGDSVEWRYDCDDLPGGEARNAFAPELCEADGIDNDCNGLIDDDDPAQGEPWYLDEDGDGVAGPDPIPLDGPTCTPPVPGAVTAPEAFDCDDDDATVYPGAPEVCDERDNDCDGVIDNDAVDASSFGIDQDGDGYFLEGSVVTQCFGRPGLIEVDGEPAYDCADTDAGRHPGAVEIPDDGVDQDCDTFDGESWVQGSGCGCAAGSDASASVVVAGLTLVVTTLRRRTRAGFRTLSP